MKWDGYFDVYEEHISKYIGQNAKLLEIGVAQGGSLEMWAKYLENPEIHGIDLHPDIVNYKYDYDNIHLTVGDQGDIDFIESFIEKNNDFDIIIDDGSHVQNHQTLSLIVLFSALKQGGIYIIEDVAINDLIEYRKFFNNS